jgi:hypothetical protein
MRNLSDLISKKWQIFITFIKPSALLSPFWPWYDCWVNTHKKNITHIERDFLKMDDEIVDADLVQS